MFCNAKENYFLCVKKFNHNCNLIEGVEHITLDAIFLRNSRCCAYQIKLSTKHASNCLERFDNFFRLVAPLISAVG